MREKKWGLLLPGLVLLLLVSLLAFSCAKQQTTPGETKTLRVGICLPLSGPCAAWGIPFRNGAALVADMRNAEGGLQIGNDRYIVELYEQDSKFTAEGAATATRNLLERSKVDLIYGSLSTAELVAELGITEPARILVVHAAAGDETISKASEIRYAFRAWVSYDHTFPALLGWVSKTYPLAKNIALLNPNIESSWSGDELAKKVAASLGMSVVYNDYFEEGTQDFTPFLVKALAAKPDFLLNTATSTPDWGLMMKQARDLGYEGLFLDIHMLDITGLTPIAGADVVEGMIGIGDVSVGPSVKQGTGLCRRVYPEVRRVERLRTGPAASVRCYVPSL